MLDFKQNSAMQSLNTYDINNCLREMLSSMDAWFKFQRNLGKPRGNGENKHQPVATEETGLLDSI